MKRSMKIIMSIVILIAFITTSLGLTAIAVKSIKLNTTSVVLQVGKTYELKVTITPANATNKKLTFSSGNRKIATVDKNGNIKGIIPGKTVITVTSASNKKAVAKCNVTISQVISFPLKKKVGLHIIVTGTAYPLTNDMPVGKAMGEITNIDFNWENVNSEVVDTTIITRLASGSNIPDIIPAGASNKLPLTSIQKLVDDGLVRSLDSIDKKYWYRWYDMVSKDPVTKSGMTFSDGKMYTFSYAEEGWRYKADLWWDAKAVRKAGLDPHKVNSTEEFKKMLLDIKKDGSYSNYPFFIWSNNFTAVFNAFGVKTKAGGFAADKNGKVYYSFMTPEYKEALEYLNRFYSEGLIEPEFETGNFDKMNEKAAKEKPTVVIAGSGGGPGAPNNQFMEGKEERWIIAPPLKGPRGDAFIEPVPTVNIGNWDSLITSASKNPEIAAMFLDWWHLSDEALKLYLFGVEDITYKLEDGKPKVLVDFMSLVRNGAYWRMANAPLLSNPWMKISMDLQANNYAKKKDVEAMFNSKQYMSVAYPNNKLTSVEQEIVTKYSLDLRTYVDEMRLKFIKGLVPLSNYDKYIEQINKLGINDLIKVEQARYDRFKSIK